MQDSIDPTLNVDTKLFVDPLLLSTSKHPEMRAGRERYIQHFSNVISLLRASQEKGDTYWRNAERLLTFPEIRWTCLGYGAASVSGSGSGPGIRSLVLTSAKDIVDLGVTDPDLFTAMALFENDVGPDRISDMTTRVILENLVELNVRILAVFGVTPEPFAGPDGQVFQLATNSTQTPRCPVLLVPLDILRSLPIAADWDGVCSAAAHNEALRNRVNRDIGNIWELQSRDKKAEVRSQVLASRKAFEGLLAMIDAVERHSYNFQGDPEGELLWRRLCSTIASEFPLQINVAKPLDVAGAKKVVEQILDRFTWLIEKRGLWKDLYRADHRPRPEKSAQMLFFAVADSYCHANDLDITPEADTGVGPVDFKFSSGYTSRIVVEIKLSTNPKVVAGFGRQLAAYAESETAKAAYYVVIDVGHLGEKYDKVVALRNSSAAGTKLKPQAMLIDGTPKQSASKR
jgi:hypothetical protein